MGVIKLHPFKEGVMSIIEAHFEPDIAKNFLLVFEDKIYTDVSQYKQKKNDTLILEMRYKSGDETSEHIGDVYSWWNKSKTEERILTYITDAYVSGKIGKNWIEKDGKISEEIISGKHQTHE